MSNMRDDDDVVRVGLEPGLPCGMRDCHRLATTALAERDSRHPGLWQIVPICDTCAQKFHPTEHRNRDDADDEETLSSNVAPKVTVVG